MENRGMRRSPESGSNPISEQWLNAIPMDSLEQLCASTTSIVDNRDPVDIALPESRSISSTGSPSNASTSQAAIPSESAYSTARASVNERAAGASTVSSIEHIPTTSAYERYFSGSNSAPEPSSQLPASTQASSEQLSSVDAPQSHHEDTRYWRKVQSLSRCLPHLSSLNPDYGRHKFAGQITCIDYYPQAPTRTVVRDTINAREIADPVLISTRVGQLKPAADLVSVTRVLLVEDLCPAVIESLGSVFEIDPEVFAAHLNRSGYDEADYDDASPDRWETHYSRKSYASMTWFRPVYQDPMLTRWTANPTDLLNKVEAVLKTKGEKRKVTLSSKISWLDPENPTFDSRGRRTDRRFRHSISVDTNILRRGWPISARPFGRDPIAVEHLGLGDILTFANSERSEMKRMFIPTAREERATIFFFEKSAVPVVILLLDPLPAFVDNKTQVLSWMSRGKRATKQRRMVRPAHVSLPFAPRTILELPANKLDADEQDIERFSQAANTISSTAQTIAQNVGHTAPAMYDGFRADSIFILFHIVQQDHRALCRAIEVALDQIGQDSLDDYLLTKQLAHWRKLITDLEIEVPAVGRSVAEYATTVFKHEFEGKAEIDAIVDTVNAEVKRIKVRLDEAYTGLRADMQFTESRRSINEAKTVNRLTELAFLFIPFSFASSLFSMSITELQNPVPVWTFVVTALGLAAVAYSVRFIISSDFIADSSRSALEKFRARGRFPAGARAPAFQLLYLTLVEVWNRGGSRLAANAGIFLFLSAFIVVPVAFMWTTTKLDAGFNTVMTLFLVLSGLALAAFPYVPNLIEAGQGGQFRSSNLLDSEDNSEEDSEEYPDEPHRHSSSSLDAESETLDAPQSTSRWTSFVRRFRRHPSATSQSEDV